MWQLTLHFHTRPSRVHAKYFSITLLVRQLFFLQKAYNSVSSRTQFSTKSPNSVQILDLRPIYRPTMKRLLTVYCCFRFRVHISVPNFSNTGRPAAELLQHHKFPASRPLGENWDNAPDVKVDSGSLHAIWGRYSSVLNRQLRFLVSK